MNQQPVPAPQVPTFFEWAWDQKIVVIPIMVILGLSICTGFIGLTYISLVNGMRSNPLHQQAVQLVSENQAVKNALGDHVWGGFITDGHVQVDEENQFGSADAEIPISGPKGNGKMRVRARLVDGTWIIDHLTATLDSGQIVMIKDETSAPVNEEKPEQAEQPASDTQTEAEQKPQEQPAAAETSN